MAADTCSATGAGTAGSCLIQRKGVVKKVAQAKALDHDDDDDDDDDEEEPEVPFFDNSPGQSGIGKPLSKCQGHCGVDEDCAGDLVCVAPKFVGWDGFVPGCRSGGHNKPLWDFKYCSDEPPEGWQTATTTTTTGVPTEPPPSAPSAVACPAGSTCARLVAFNVYYANLGSESRMEGIAEAVVTMMPDIAVITEEWHEKPKILAKIKEKSNRYYEFCNSGPQEEWWDGDILYRADLFDVVEDSVMDWGANRGLSWAVLKHKESGKQVLVYGAHPVCCGNEPIHLQNALDFSEHAQEMVSKYPNTPIVYMGDFNALEDWDSTKLYLGDDVHHGGKHYSIAFKFKDAYREFKGPYADATTHNSGARLDYIFLERGDTRAVPITQGFETIDASIWRNPGPPGGSDHYPIRADVKLTA